MSDNEKGKLERQVFEFIKKQPGYDKNEHEQLKAFCENKDTWAVVYGEDIHSGIAGFGETADEAFEDFTMSWKHFKGFEWLKKEKQRLYHWNNRKN